MRSKPVDTENLIEDERESKKDLFTGVPSFATIAI